MSRFLSPKYSALTPYTPGEQPQKTGYVKLNTNESPFSPSPYAIKAAYSEMKQLELYPDPECAALRRSLAELCGINEKQVVATNGSDEALYFAFLAFCDANRPAAFADVTYGFYKVFAELLGINCRIIPLKDDFSIDPGDYINAGATIFIANPNAPTGLALSRDEIEYIVAGNPDHLVVVDEAYVGFGAESCVNLIHRYDNLLVVRTFSKSYSMAGARLGFAMGNEALIRDLDAIRYSTNPYNINRMTMAAGIGALADRDYFYACLRTITENREYAANELKKLGFTGPRSSANFLFVKHPDIGGKELYEKLKARNVLIRHFEQPRIRDYNRITVGTFEQMNILIKEIKAILEENA